MCVSVDTMQVLDTDKLDRGRFREFLHNAFDMTDDILLDRIFKEMRDQLIDVKTFEGFLKSVVVSLIKY